MLSLPNDGRYPTLELAPQQRRQKTLVAFLDSDNACFAALVRDKLAVKMTQAQINEAQRLAREWLASTQPPVAPVASSPAPAAPGPASTALAMGAATTAQEQPPIVRDVLSIHDDLDNMCRGWAGDDPHTDEACAVRLKVDKLLGKLGYCYGTTSDFGPNGRGRAGATWHSCTNVYRP